MWYGSVDELEMPDGYVKMLFLPTEFIQNPVTILTAPTGLLSVGAFSQVKRKIYE